MGCFWPKNELEIFLPIQGHLETNNDVAIWQIIMCILILYENQNAPKC
jgi:hypothetical protein